MKRNETTSLNSCAVALPTQRNYATHLEDAMFNSPQTQYPNLVALSIKVLERNNNNQSHNTNATSMLSLKENNTTIPAQLMILNQKSCAVALPKGCNNATVHLQLLIGQVSTKYGGDDDKFLQEYTEDVVNAYASNMSAAITCFKDILNRK